MKAWNFRDLIGERFGSLRVISYAGKRGKKKAVSWNCLCDCGNEVVVISYNLINGNTRSCGCLHKKIISEVKKTHGMSFSPEYHSYTGMIQRCYYEKNISYKNYGGRGITVCDDWLESFDNFYRDMGDRPSKKHSLDRIDNSKGYCKKNCRWATRKEQNGNSRKNIIVIVDGKEMILQEAAEKYGIKRSTVSMRLKYGWSIEDALKTPVCKRR